MKLFNILLIALDYLILFGLKIKIAEGIIGGHEVPEGFFKYHVAIRKSNGLYVCGGAIIGERHVITAAQCIIDKENHFIDEKFIVTAGTREIHIAQDRTIVILVHTAYVPSEYVPIEFENAVNREIGDIAVLKLANIFPMKLITTVSPPIRKGGKFTKYMSQNALITGFGIKKSSIRRGDNKNELATLSDTLQFAQATVRQLTSCNNMWRDRHITDAHLCAQVEQPEIGTSAGVCHGDIGGPLVIGDIIIGILVSLHPSCNEELFAGIYTRVSDYTSFISQSLSNNQLPNTRVAVYYGITVVEIVTNFSDLMSNKATASRS